MDTTDSLAAGMQVVMGAMRWPTSLLSALYAQPRFTPSSNPAGCSGTTTSAQMAPRSTRGHEESISYGTSHAPIRWPRRIFTVHQRRQGRLQRQRKRRSGQSTWNSPDPEITRSLRSQWKRLEPGVPRPWNCARRLEVALPDAPATHARHSSCARDSASRFRRETQRRSWGHSRRKQLLLPR